MIKADSVKAKYDNYVVFENINFELPNTGLIAIRGDNGSGKSMVLNLLGGIIKPRKGTIEVDQKIELSTLSEEEMTSYREKYISFFLKDTLFENMSVKENLTLYGHTKNFFEVIEKMHLKNILNRSVKDLNEEEKTLVTMAIALIKDSKIILADSNLKTPDFLDYEALLMELSKDRLVVVECHDENTLKNSSDIEIQVKDHDIAVTIRQKEERTNKKDLFKNSFSVKTYAFSNRFKIEHRTFFLNIIVLLFGIGLMILFSLNTRDLEHVQSSTLLESGKAAVVFQKILKDGGTITRLDNNLEEKDISYLEKNKISSKKLQIGTRVEVANKPIGFNIDYNYSENTKRYYRERVEDIAFFGKADLNDLIYGKSPTKKDEIVISSYLAEQIVEFGIESNDKGFYHPKNIKSIIDDKVDIKLGNKFVQVSGIYDLRLDRFKDLDEKDISGSNLSDIFSLSVLHQAGNVYVDDEFYTLFADETPSIDDDYTFSLAQSVDYNIENNDYHYNTISNVHIFDNPVELRDRRIIESLEENEIILSSELMKKKCTIVENCIGREMDLYIRHKDSPLVKKSLRLVMKGVSDDGYTYLNEKAVEGFTSKQRNTVKAILYEDDEKAMRDILKEFSGKNDKFIVDTSYSADYETIKELRNFIGNILVLVVAFIGALLLINSYMFLKRRIDIRLREIAVLKSSGVPSKQIEKSFLYWHLTDMLVPFIYAIFGYLGFSVIANNFASHIYKFNAIIIPFKAIPIFLSLIIMTIIVFILYKIDISEIEKIEPKIIFDQNKIPLGKEMNL